MDNPEVNLIKDQFFKTNLYSEKFDRYDPCERCAKYSDEINNLKFRTMYNVKMLKILEVIWLVIAIIGIAAFIFTMISGNQEQAMYFIVFTLISGVMYAIRRRQRKYAEKVNSNNKPN